MNRPPRSACCASPQGGESAPSERLLGRVIAALATCFVGAVAAQSAPAPIRAPHYGDTLFHFYQDHWFGAITGLMVSQHFGRVAPHDDEAEVLRGGMMLSYGLHEQASEIFAPRSASSLSKAYWRLRISSSSLVSFVRSVSVLSV